MYPEGDRTAPPSGRMPTGGYLLRHDHPPGADRRREARTSRTTWRSSARSPTPTWRTSRDEADRLYTTTDQAILANFGGTAFGDIALVPAPWLKHPKGIRDIAEWYMSTVTRRDYVYEVFERQCEIGLANLARIHAAVGDRVAPCSVTGTDFGTQNGPFISPKAYRKLFQPFHRAVNDWVHAHTAWKTFIHSCGSVVALLPDFIEAGFDILNPVQCSAAGMDPRRSRSASATGSPSGAAASTRRRRCPSARRTRSAARCASGSRSSRRGGGFVFNTVHNVQPKTPVENLLALYETVKEYREGNR